MTNHPRPRSNPSEPDRRRRLSAVGSSTPTPTTSSTVEAARRRQEHIRLFAGEVADYIKAAPTSDAHHDLVPTALQREREVDVLSARRLTVRPDRAPNGSPWVTIRIDDTEAVVTPVQALAVADTLTAAAAEVIVNG